MTKTEAGIVFAPLPENDPVRRRPDTTKARQLLNWQAATDLYTGLSRTIKYFSELAGQE